MVGTGARALLRFNTHTHTREAFDARRLKEATEAEAEKEKREATRAGGGGGAENITKLSPPPDGPSAGLTWSRLGADVDLSFAAPNVPRA